MHTLPLSPHHIPLLATLTIRAFLDDALFAWLRPHRREYLSHWHAYTVRKLHSRLNTPGTVMRVAVSDDSDGWWDEGVGEEVLGYAIFERRGGNGAVWGADGWGKRFERMAMDMEMWYTTWFRLDKSCDDEHLALFLAGQAGVADVIGRHVDNDNHIWLSMLGVDPRFHRRGVGKRLLQWGLSKADEEGVQMGLIASPAGRRLYESVGFQDVGILKIEGCPLTDSAYIRWPNGERKDIKLEEKIVTERTSDFYVEG